MAKIADKEEKQHVHFWQSGYNEAEKKCTCGKILISPKELERRTAEWNRYYEECRTTESAFDFWEMKRAFSQKNQVLVKEVLERVKKRMVRNENEQLVDLSTVERLPKPHFPDPDSGAYITADFPVIEDLSKPQVLGFKGELYPSAI